MSRNSDIIRDSRGFLAIKQVLLVVLIAVVGDLFFTLVGDVIDDKIGEFYGGSLILALVATIFGAVMLGTLYQLITFNRSERGVFDYFKNGRLLWVLIKISVLQAIFTMLWSILLLIPGIVKAYAYTQAIPKAVDDFEKGRPLQGALAYIGWSDDQMKGYKGQLFMLTLTWYVIMFALIILIYLGYVVLTHQSVGIYFTDNTFISAYGSTLITIIPSLIAIPTIIVRQTVFSRDFIREQDAPVK